MIVGRTPLVSRSASPVSGMEERLSPRALNGPIILTSKTREVETGVIASAPWPEPLCLGCIAGSQAPRLVMVKEAEYATAAACICILHYQ